MAAALASNLAATKFLIPANAATAVQQRSMQQPAMSCHLAMMQVRTMAAVHCQHMHTRCRYKRLQAVQKTGALALINRCATALRRCAASPQLPFTDVHAGAASIVPHLTTPEQTHYTFKHCCSPCSRAVRTYGSSQNIRSPEARNISRSVIFEASAGTSSAGDRFVAVLQPVRCQMKCSSCWHAWLPKLQ
jgi:hypothetical protein